MSTSLLERLASVSELKLLQHNLFQDYLNGLIDLKEYKIQNHFYAVLLMQKGA